EHLGKPLVDALKGREEKVRVEMGRLDEAEREVTVTLEEATLAAAQAEETRIEAEQKALAVHGAEKRAMELRLARERCKLRDATEAALRAVDEALAARAPDRTRAE